MATFVPYIVAAFVIALTFALKPLRAWLETRAQALTGQSELVEIYQTNVAKFLRLTSQDDHAELRDMLVWAGHRMMRGAWLVDGLSDEKPEVSEAAVDPIDEEFDSLSQEQMHAWARAMGAALCVSATQSPLQSAKHEAILKWVLSEPNGEVKEPKQVVHRFRQASQLPVGRSQVLNGT